MTPEQVAEMQRKNCIFCKIIAGEIESKKVYEDDEFVAILDIRPAAPGHVLLLPKQHVPILPLLGEAATRQLFERAAALSQAIKEAMIAERVTIFLASGYAAGQQAPHVMLHLIPRERGDGLEKLDADQMAVAQSDALALAPLFGQAVQQMLSKLERQDLLGSAVPARSSQADAPVSVPRTSTLPAKRASTTVRDVSPRTPALPTKGAAIDAREAKSGTESTPPQQEPDDVAEFNTMTEALEAAIAMSPDLKRLIIAQPDLVADYVKQSPKLAKLFEGVNIHALSLVMQRQDAARNPRVERTAAMMPTEELMHFIDGNEGLRQWLIEHPEEFASRLGENPRLSAFFKDVDVLLLARTYRDWKLQGGGV
jgi:histidine triad (HIT) family protein